MSETATKKKEPGMATLVIVLFAICAATALLLGLTNYVTAPFIAANNEKTTQEAMAAVLPADSYDEVEYTGGDAMVQAVYKAGDAGYVVEVKPATSFSGNLTIMVGVDNTGACSGISITSTGETSGLGSNASKPDFQAQFVGKTGEVKVTKDGGDIDALTEMVDRHTCAVMLELVQGEGGVVALDPEYVQAVRALCDEKDLVLIVDEVQTGVGRTGTFLCCEHYNLQPDVVTLAKGLGGGLPIGAVLMNEKVAAGMGPSSHGSTFGGNPVVCAGANVVVDRMDASFLANVNERAVQLRAGLEKLPRVRSLSGIGLMVGIEFLEGIKAADVLAACREKGLLVLTAKTRLRLLPPLTLTAHDVEMALEILGSVLAEMDPSKTEEQA